MTRGSCMVLLVAALAAACSTPASPAGVRLRVEGRGVWIDAAAAPRGVQLELAWDEGVRVSAIEPGADAARLDLVRARLADDGRSARVLVSDTRGVPLPLRGEILHVVAEGEGALRVVSVVAAGGAP